jgi:hypothetical protein
MRYTVENISFNIELTFTSNASPEEIEQMAPHVVRVVEDVNMVSRTMIESFEHSASAL